MNRVSGIEQPPAAPGRRRSWTSTWSADAALVAALTLACLLGGWPQRSPWGSATVLATTAPLLTRRRLPLSSFAVQLAAVGVTGPFGKAPIPVLLTLVLGGLSAAGVEGRRPQLLTAAGLAGTVTMLHFADKSRHEVLGLPALWLLSFALRSLWQRWQTTHAYAQALERERAADQALAVRNERERIARELHDVLGHNLSVMMIHAGAARQAVDGNPDATESLLQVEAAGRQAMAELRSLLELLGTEQDDVAPQPCLADLGYLVDRIHAAGLPARLITRGEPRSLETGLELAAYRVAQEGLTNALRHAGGAQTEVSVEYTDAELCVEVRDQGAAAQADAHADGSGRGLFGLRQRVALYHGELQAGPRADGGYRLRARFPIDAGRLDARADAP